jgi:single-strand DNA-binding protein
MANLNKVMLIGRLTRDPEARTFSNGGKVAKFGFAVNNRRKNASTGQWEDEPVFIDAEIFNRGDNGNQADRLEQTVRKGQQIFIEGHLKMDSWTSQDGQKRTKLVIVVDNFQYLEARGEGGMNGEGGMTRAPRPANTAPRKPAAPSFNNGNGDYDEPEPLDATRDDDIPF